jgi:hypothetical protein
MKTFKSLTIYFSLLIFSIAIISSCKKDKDGDNNGNNNNNPPVVDTQPTELPCSYFSEDRLLDNDTNKQVDYYINCVANVSGNINIQPGVVIEFGPNAGLRIVDGGSIRAIGFEESKIRFTGKVKVKGYWKGIRIDSNSPLNELNHTVIEFAGGEEFSGKKGGIVVWSGGRLKVKNSEIINNDAAGLTAEGANINEVTNIELENNKFSGNTLSALQINTVLVGMANSTNDFSGNGLPYIKCINYTSEFRVNTVWKNVNVPYMITGAVAAIQNNSILSIQPGTRLVFDSNTGIRINEGSALKAIGTSEEPIVFRGLSNAPGAWKGLYFAFTENVNNQISHAKIENAGEGQAGAIYMWASPKLSVDNVSFKNLSTCAIYGAPGSGSPNPNLTTSDLSFENVAGEICGD